MKNIISKNLSKRVQDISYCIFNNFIAIVLTTLFSIMCIFGLIIVIGGILSLISLNGIPIVQAILISVATTPIYLNLIISVLQAYFVISIIGTFIRNKTAKFYYLAGGVVCVLVILVPFLIGIPHRANHISISIFISNLPIMLGLFVLGLFFGNIYHKLIVYLEKNKRRTIFIGLIALILAVISSYFGFSVAKEVNNFLRTVMPWNAGHSFNYSKKPVEIKIGETTYLIPKAYLKNKQDRKGGELSSVEIWVSPKDNYAAWPLSESFKNREKGTTMIIRISGSILESYRSNYPCRRVLDSKKRYEKRKLEYPDFDMSNFDAGIYKDIFHKYNTIDYKGKIFGNMYLVPIINTDKDYEISCPSLGKPKYLKCTVSKLHTDKITYNYQIHLSDIERFLEYDKNVEKLVENFIKK